MQLSALAPVYVPVIVAADSAEAHIIDDIAWNVHDMIAEYDSEMLSEAEQAASLEHDEDLAEYDLPAAVGAALDKEQQLRDAVHAPPSPPKGDTSGRRRH
mmetsp:Transcript_35726/g.112239  ORF Transcript_35726/g.112239 Transcript_35726/m.112239 type:complete len:100 (-) Transcript_35726:301-600(-)